MIIAKYAGETLFATVYFLFLETKISTLTEKKRGKLDSQY